MSTTTVQKKPVRIVGGPHNDRTVDVELGVRRITVIEFDGWLPPATLVPEGPETLRYSFSQVEHEIVRLSNGEWVAVRIAPRPQAATT